MPKTKISEFSATAGNNTDIDGINIAEGCPPSGINDAIRELMAQLKDFQAGTAGDSFNGPVGTTTPAAGAFTNLSASGTFALTGDQVQISEGGTGQTTANAAFNALAPSQSTHAGKYLKTDGTNTSWDAIEINTADITGTLPVANGGTGVTSSTGTGSVVLSASPTFTGTVNGAALTLSSSLTLSGGTANGVAYLNGSKVLTTGSALSFDGTTFIATGAARVKAVSSGDQIRIEPGSAGSGVSLLSRNAADNDLTPLLSYGSYQTWYVAGGARAMDLTSTGLGIGTSSPAYKLDVSGSGRVTTAFAAGGAPTGYGVLQAVSDDANTAPRQISIRGTSNGNKGMFLGYNTTSNYGSIQPLIDGTGWSDLVLCPSGGNVGIGTSSITYRLDVSAGNGQGIRFTDSVNSVQNFLGAQNSVGLLGTLSNHPVAFWTNNAEKMRLDSSGNLGLGVTPSAWGLRAIDIGTGAGIGGTSGGIYIAQNAYYTTQWVYKLSAAASLYSPESGSHKWYVAPSGTAGNAISFTQAMTLDASGNLGVGATSPAAKVDAFAASGWTGVYTSSGSRFVGIASDSSFANDISWDSSSALRFSTATNKAAASYTERARITSGGKLGLNTSSPSGLFTVYNTTAADFTSQANLENSSALTINSNQATSVVTFQGATGNVDKFIAVDNYGGTQYFSLGYQNGATRRNVIQFDQNDTIYFSTAGTERARITSGGALLVGTTNNTLGAADGVVIGPIESAWTVSNSGNVPIRIYNKGSSGTRYCMEFRTASTAVGTITHDGTNTAYNTSSDYRLKDNQQPLTGSSAFIDALKPKTWTWKETGSRGVGFIAHEVQEVSPGSVVGTKDAVDEEGKPIMQAMEYGSAEFIANIIAELQSLRARVAQLEAK